MMPAVVGKVWMWWRGEWLHANGILILPGK